jgi:pyrroloquinoline quinone biosynthesis protein B
VGEVLQLDDDVSIVAHVVPHRGELTDTVAFEVRGPERRLLYVPDIDRWEKWDRTLGEAVASVDIALLDGTFHDAKELPDRKLEDIPHPLIPHTIEMLGAAGRGKVWFTHMNHSNEAADTAGPARRAIERAGYGVASDGQVFPL